MYSKVELINYLKEYYPDTDNTVLCNKLDLSPSALRTIASRNKIKKSKSYLDQQRQLLLKAKEKKYLKSIPEVNLNVIEKNIIVGSILGDGNLTFAPRSRNAYYREHFGIKQKQYREWKKSKITSLPFRIEKNGTNLKSPSHPIFTEYYKNFYINKTKTITKENIKLLGHPVGLACLYLDDGTLMISVSKKNSTLYITPSISLTTLCFSEKECQILCDHINKAFKLNFLLANHPSGKNILLRISQLNELDKFFNLIEPYCQEISSMQYKWDLPMRLEAKKQELHKEYGDKYRIRVSSVKDIPPRYTAEEEQRIIKMKQSGKKDREIAQALNRNYWGIVDKICRLRKANKL